MPEIEEEVMFHTRAGQVKFSTSLSGDSIQIEGLKLTQTKATVLAWLVNVDSQAELEFQIKVKNG